MLFYKSVVLDPIPRGGGGGEGQIVSALRLCSL